VAIQINTSGSDGKIVRATSLNYNAAYTVLFRLYVASSSTSAFIWGMCDSAGTASSTQFGNNAVDKVRFDGSGNIRLTTWSGSAGADTTMSTLASSTWHSIAIIRSSNAAIKIRVNGTNSSTDTTSMAARNAVACEVWGFDDNAFNGLPTGFRITNYKAWTSALTDGEVDAEFAATAFTVSSNKFSGSPMGDASVSSNNASADGSGTAWTLDTQIIAGANDPGVTYGSSFIARRTLLGVG
jgi:hypothetical protein